jgi:human immunodeficiency virus type I enhancer-binding protein
MLLHSYFLDDPGGTRDIKGELKKLSAASSAINNCTNVDKLSTKDQIVTSIATSTINSSSPVTSTSLTTANDSKYLHKKFKKFCATVDNSSHHQINNNSHNNTIANTPTSTPTTNAIDGRLNNNSEIVVNKNSSSNNNNNNLQSSVRSSVNNNISQSLSVPSSHPKHSLTTEEEKQLVKDIIDINNENFMHHQSANNYYNHHLNNNQSTSSFLITPAASGSQFVTVTTLGNHNSNLQQLADHRQKIPASNQQQESSIGSFNQTSNGNFVIVSQPSSVEIQQQISTTSISSVPATTSSSTITTATSTPGRYICPYCQLNCAKPSVLQKHIRAHTNERPFPCILCGFAFKTKSNLYKHCR